MITKAALLLLIMFFEFTAQAQYDSTLTKINEEVIFTFKLETGKSVSVCKEKNSKYLVYRTGTPNKIDLQIPTILDTSSWHRFRFSGYNRGGGRQNAAMHFGYLNFGTKGVGYEVYELWNSEDSIEHCGLYVIFNGKMTDLKGDIQTKQGNLVQLMLEQKIKQEEEDTE
jgi:hypothetical protein